MADLTGKVFIITGGNGGIGLGMARGIVDAGGSVAVWGRNTEKNEAAANDLEARGGVAASFVCDVSDEDSVREAMRLSLDRFGRLDGLFANAGRPAQGTPFLESTLEQWRAVMAVNLDGVYLTLREAAKVLVEQGEGGSLVAVSSTSSIHGAAGTEAYGTSKTAVNGLMRALAVGLARHQIRVNSLLPGWTVTDMVEPLLGNDRFMDATTRRTPVRRWGEPADFGEVAAFLADPTQLFHTGQEVCVDGGYTVF